MNSPDNAQKQAAPRGNKRLTDKAIKQALPRTRKYTIADGEGLCIEIHPNGSKRWKYRYRRPHDRKSDDFPIGTYPAVPLKEARKKHQEAKTLVAEGIDPKQHKNAQKAKQAAQRENSFSLIAEEWFNKQALSWADSTAKKNRALLNNDLLPYLSSRPINGIETYELVGVLERVVERGAIDTAHKCRQILNQVCRFAKQTGRANQNPAADLAGVLPKKDVEHHAAITDPAKFGQLLVDIDSYTGTNIIRTLFMLAPLLFQRPDEMAGMKWEDLDLDAAVWNIPKGIKKERAKRIDDHIVPLPVQAVDLIKDLRPLTGNRTYVFPNQRNPREYANPASVNKALRQLGYSTKKVQSFHGFRSSARTMMDEQLNIRIEWIEHQLAHAVKDPLGRAYNRTKHLPQRHEMMQHWANYLDDLKRQTLAGNVITGSFGQTS